MKRITIVLLPGIAFLLYMLASAGSAAEGKKIIGPGDELPAHAFQYTLDSQDREYLGVSQGFFPFFGTRDFSLQHIPAEILVVEFFNIYCTSCQAQAPVLNEVYKAVTQNSALQEKVRFIGIGAGNNSNEVEQFRKDKQIAFPLIPDTDFAFYTAVGDPGGTPFTVIAKRTSQGITVLSANLGLVKDADVLVQQIQEAAMPGAAGKPLVREADLPAVSSDRLLELRLPESALLEKVKESMLAACPAGTQTGDLAKITLSGGQTVYRGEFTDGGVKKVLFSRVISRKPVCDVCHGVHFIVTFDSAGTVRAFSPIHITKYGNMLWKEAEVQFMASRLVGRSIKKGLSFDPAADAVSTATMSSALIVNSINSLRPVLEELSQRPQ